MSSLQTKPLVVQSSATTSIVVHSQAQAGSSSANLRNLKGSMTLPLQPSVNVGSNLSHMRGFTPLAQLNSPDLKNLPSGVTPFLTSPDFEKLVSQSLAVGITPTSAGGNAPQTPTTFLNPKFVTEEQERFVMNFDEKIKNMIKKEREGGVDENQLNTPVIMDISGPAYPGAVSAAAATGEIAASQQPGMFSAAVASAHHLAAASAVALAPAVTASAVSTSGSVGSLRAQLNGCYSDSDEPMDQATSSVGSPGGGRPVDMSEQEHMKLERKRQRNRDAARKCRERKLERIRFLEERVAELKSQNGRLQRTAVDLREQVKTLQHVIVEHTKRGCSLKDTLSAKLGLA